MEKFIVMGGNRLTGEIAVNGAKNAILPIMAASLITKGKSTLFNVPIIQDVLVMQKVMEYLGAKVVLDGNMMYIDSEDVKPRGYS